MLASFCLGLAQHVQGDAPADVRLGPDAVHALLHLPVAAIATLDRVRRRPQQLVIKNTNAFSRFGENSLFRALPNFRKRRTRRTRYVGKGVSTPLSRPAV